MRKIDYGLRMRITEMCSTCAFSKNGHVCRRPGIGPKGQEERLKNGECPDAGIYAGSVIQLMIRRREGDIWSFVEPEIAKPE